MSKQNLYEQWSAEDAPYKDTDLAKKTFSYRFPVHVAARLAAIEDMFPGKSRTEVIIGILKLGLAQFEESLPVTQKQRPVTESEAEHIAVESGQSLKQVMATAVINEGLSGPKADYVKKANAYFTQLEKERGIKHPQPVFKV